MPNLLKSKSFWAGLAVVIAGIGKIIAEGNYGAMTEVMAGIGLILAGREGPKSDAAKIEAPKS